MMKVKLSVGASEDKLISVGGGQNDVELLVAVSKYPGEHDVQ